MSIAEVIPSPPCDPIEAARRVYEAVMAQAGAHRAVALQLRADEIARHIRRAAGRSASTAAPGQALQHWLKSHFRQNDDPLKRAAVAAMALGLERRIAALPAEVQELYPSAHVRLAAMLERARAYGDEQLSRDAGLVAGLCAPAGCLSIVTPDPHPGEGAPLWAKRAASGFVRQAMQFGAEEARTWLAAAGARPWAELHLDVRSLENFNAEGFVQVYRRVAALLRTRPDLAGLYAASWLYDPRVSAISPGLAFVRRTAEDGGARIVRLKVDPVQTGFAVARSPARRALVESGRYRPACYAMYWGAADLIAWADRSGTDRSGADRDAANSSAGRTANLQVVRK